MIALESMMVDSEAIPADRYTEKQLRVQEKTLRGTQAQRQQDMIDQEHGKAEKPRRAMAMSVSRDQANVGCGRKLHLYQGISTLFFTRGYQHYELQSGRVIKLAVAGIIEFTGPSGSLLFRGTL